MITIDDDGAICRYTEWYSRSKKHRDEFGRPFYPWACRKASVDENVAALHLIAATSQGHKRELRLNRAKEVVIWLFVVTPLHGLTQTRFVWYVKHNVLVADKLRGLHDKPKR